MVLMLYITLHCLIIENSNIELLSIELLYVNQIPMQFSLEKMDAICYCDIHILFFAAKLIIYSQLPKLCISIVYRVIRDL